MAEPSFGKRLAATLSAELECFSDDQLEVAANIIDREYALSQGKLGGFALEHSSPVRRGGKKEREELFDALCGSCGIQREGMTHPLVRSVSVALTAIMAVMPTLTTKEIILRSREYRRKHPTWELTPNSLAKHWSSCAVHGSERGLLDEPAGWRTHSPVIFPEELAGSTGEMLARDPWEKIGRVYQEKIIRWMTNHAAIPRQPHAD